MNPAPVAAALSTRPVSHPGAGVNALMRSMGTTIAGATMALVLVHLPHHSHIRP